MSEAAAIDRDEALLDELGGMLMSAARMAHERMGKAADERAFHDAGQTLHRMARSLRQTLALKARLKQGPARGENDSDAAPAKPGGAAIARRIADLRTAVSRVVWDEAEGPEEADWRLDDLEYVIVEEMQKDAFLAEDLDDHVARICLSMGLDPARIGRWRELPDPPSRERREPAPLWESSS